jgi:predicted  nucleic acid-binding Zn-ribbon protein
LSALTKVFVVLHVVVSLLLVAGMVVFVNKVENFSAVAKQAQSQLEMVKREKSAIETKDLQVIAEKNAAAVEANDRANKLAAAYQSLQSSIATVQTSLATTTAANATAATQITTLTNALRQAQDTNAATEVVINGLRTRSDEVEKKYTESQVALSDLNNRLDALSRELNYSKEQVAALETELKAARDQLATGPVRGVAPGTSAGPALGPSGQVPSVLSNVTIRGVVKNKFQVGEVAYATVSVGSADSVSKGERFNVTDPSGQQFLGYLIIDSVNPNEASGHLNGPKVEAVQKGSTVVSNWQ